MLPKVHKPVCIVDMSIFSKILQPILRKEIKKTMMKYWKEFLEPFIEVLSTLIAKWGTKFILALGAEGGLFYLVYDGRLEPRWGAACMAIVAIAYFVSRVKETAQTTRPPQAP